MAGKSTLNRLELTPAGTRATSRYKKIVARHGDLESWFVEAFLQLTPQAPSEIVLDLDATDDPLHGHQLGRFFHGYYEHYCYLPLYVFAGEHLLCAKLRPADIDAAAGSVKVVEQIVRQIRRVWPQVRIILRGDSGFCRENLMSWCEQHGVDYLFGLAKNSRLQRIFGRELHEAQLEFAATGKACRLFADFAYQTRKSWSRERRVVGKAEHLAKGSNPRFVVTSLTSEECDARSLYEKRCCAAKWRIASKNSSCACSPTAPVATPCGQSVAAVAEQRQPLVLLQAFVGAGRGHQTGAVSSMTRFAEAARWRGRYE